jgi:apolipoprotein N-acyltransferase
MKPKIKTAALLAASALLFTLAFPPLPTGFLACFFLLPFLALLEMHGFRAGFRYGFFLGLLCTGSTLHWMVANAGASAVQALGMLVGSMIHLSVGYGIFGFLTGLTCRRFGRAGLLAVPFIWTAIEFVYAHGELAFSWLSLATTQTYYLPLIQVASVTGMFGVVFAIAAVNTLLYLAWRDPSRRGRLVAAAVGLIAALSIGGAIAISRAEPAPSERIKVAVVQPNTDPLRKWTERNLAFRELMKLTAALDDPPYDLVVWPETATPVRLLEDEERLADVRELLAELDAPLMTGGLGRRLLGPPDEATADKDGVETRSERIRRQGMRSTNNIYLIRHDVDRVTAYEKVRLVPIGEHVPRVVWFLEDMFMDVGTGSLVPGEEKLVLKLPLYRGGAAREVPIAAVVCLEAVFGPFVRDFITQGARALVVVTNDAWYDGTSQPYQHSQITVLRAVEHRIPVLRSANSGISSVFDRYGHAVAQTQSREQTVIEALIPIDDRRSFYTFSGDWFPLSVSAIAAALAIYLLGGVLLRRLGRKP